MSYQELVNYIIRHHDSRFLLPLAKQYKTKVWNKAMHEAWQRMGLSNQHKIQPYQHTPYEPLPHTASYRRLPKTATISTQQGEVPK